MFLTSLLDRLKPAPTKGQLTLSEGSIPLLLVRHPRARRYVLRLLPDGSARVTIPRSGSVESGQKFAERNLAWIEAALKRNSERSVLPQSWSLGDTILLRGESLRIELGPQGEQQGHVRLGLEQIQVKDATLDLRPEIETYLRNLAVTELPPRVLELAATHGLSVRRVTVRNQKTRWGSCSRRGTISLNWRIIQAPSQVRDYLILHELMHLRQMNHSPAFWREVENVCPSYRTAEQWLKQRRLSDAA